MWILLYRTLYLPALLLALPYYGWRMWKRGGYGEDFKQRLGFFPSLPPKHAERPRIWLQAVSVGEVLALDALIRELSTRLNAEIVLTTTTSTGYAEARKRYAGRCLVIGLFPLDFVCFSRRHWRRINPDWVITMESELWPEHLHQAKQRGIPVYVVNARLSDRSFRRYQKLGALSRRLLQKPACFYPASQDDADRLEKLGVPAERIQLLGNIKLDVAPRTRLSDEARSQLRRELGFRLQGDSTTPLVLLGASTWPGEEQLLVETLVQGLQQGLDCYLLLVPRHAERRAEIIRTLSQFSLPYHVRSRDGMCATDPVRIHLADTTGELSQLAQAADVAFIGKSLPPNSGGQTPIEAVTLGLPSDMGPHMQNFRAVVAALVAANAVIQSTDAANVRTALLQLLSDPNQRAKLSSASTAWSAEQSGISSKIAAHLASINLKSGVGSQAS